jgi:hypothetical protein
MKRSPSPDMCAVLNRSSLPRTFAEDTQLKEADITLQKMDEAAPGLRRACLAEERVLVLVRRTKPLKGAF